MKHIVKLAKGILFVVILVILFFKVQDLFQVKWVWTMERTETSPTTSTWTEFRSLEENSIDILFLGTSHVYHAIDPMYIYEQSGITSYALCGPAARIDTSYLVLKDALKTQTPKVVFFDMSAVHWTGPLDEALTHKVLDQLEWSDDKIEYAYTNDVEGLDPMSVLFPLFRYHTRWNQLGQDDFQFVAETQEDTYVRGHYITYRAQKAVIKYDLEDMEFMLTDRYLKYLDRIVELCRTNNIDLVLYKTPTPGWRKSLSQGCAAYAEEEGIPFYDMNLYYKKMGIDVETDFKDKTDHLNQYGAEKFCDAMIAMIQDNWELEDQRETNERWNTDLLYYKYIKWKKLQESLGY